ncbi:MAG: aldehyde dehydrogenase EutE [Nitrospinae bacterium]|nr:aldehyde dehydrogenase EutE [Nitrospinota bacterium]
MSISKDQIAEIVERVARRIASEQPAAGPVVADKPSSGGRGVGIYDTVEEAVSAAKASFHTLDTHPLAERKLMIEAMRNAARQDIETLARIAVEETGLGRVADKILKNTLVVEKTPGVEIIEPKAFTGDDGIALMERAPYGVIGSITPCTNPTETVICNAIGMIAGGNAVVFNAHPAAKNTTAHVINLLNQAIISVGGPANLLTAVANPTVESAGELMRHKDIRLLVVTGGPAVVKAAMNSGKKVIAAGPGNPPVVVDETANLEDAAKHVVDGASFDNNIVCVVEKVLICVDKVADDLKRHMKKFGAYEINASQVKKLEKLVVERAPSGPGDHGVINKKWVGKDAWKILRAIGVDASEDIRLVVFDAEKGDPLVVMEQLMPILPLVRVADVDEGVSFAKIIEHGFGHTAVMHSTNVDNLSKMARVINTSIFVKNGPSFAGLGWGGEGYTSFSIASPTGEGLTTALNFTRERRCTLKDRFRII